MFEKLKKNSPTGIEGFIKPWLSRIPPYVPGETIEGKIKLASNENNYGPSPFVYEAIKNCVRNIYLYPYIEIDVRKKIAEYVKKSDVNVEFSNVLFGNGSYEILEIIMKTFKSPYVNLNPTFSGYKLVSKILNEKYYTINLNANVPKDKGWGYFSLIVDKVIEMVNNNNATVIFLCNPNNPTGSVVPLEDIEKILKTGKILVVDEAYIEFFGLEKSSVKLLDKYDNLIILRTFSKAFALAGLRTGYAIANKKLIEVMNRVKQPFNTNFIAQNAAISALFDLEYMQNCVKKIIDDRDRIGSKLSEKFIVFKSSANFLLVDTSNTISSDEFHKFMIKNGIIIRKFGKFEGFKGDYVRINAGTSDENKRLIEVLNRFQKLY